MHLMNFCSDRVFAAIQADPLTAATQKVTRGTVCLVADKNDISCDVTKKLLQVV